MTTPSTRNLRKAGPFPLGINNIANESRLPRDEFGARIAMREGENVDLDPEGVPKRRPGYDQVHVGVLTHSLWSHDLLPFALFVDDGVLHAMDAAATVQSLGVEVGNRPVSYTMIGQTVFWTAHNTCGVVGIDMAVSAWAPEQPAGQPTLAATTGYALPEGRYQVAITYIDSLGRESGSTVAEQVEVADQGGIQLTLIPQPAGDDVDLVNVYLTDNNDQVLRRHSSVPVGTTSHLIGSKAKGRALGTQFLVPMPAGDIVARFGGRQFVAIGRRMIWSAPLRYGMYDPARDQFMVFPADIDIIAPIDLAGMLVAAGPETYWLSGTEPAAFTLKRVYGAGAVPGSAIEVPSKAFGLDGSEMRTVWLARDGQFLAGVAGGVEPLNFGRAAVDDADRGAPLYRKGDGQHRLVMGLKGARKQSIGITDRAITHVIYDQFE